MERPCRSKDWFGLAEQAINTVYAIGDCPDVFCNNLIHTLTRRVFKKDAQTSSQSPSQARPEEHDQEMSVDGADGADAKSAASSNDKKGEATDAFELSQLLFVVGHVAIKHIVYLELVERELKRQKDERTAGKFSFIPYAKRARSDI
jgi:condensin complex subunit 1